MKLKDVLLKKVDIDDRGWLYQGVGWGFFMFVVIGIILPVTEGDTLTFSNLGMSLIIFLVGGLCYGFGVKLLLKRS